MPAAWAQTGPTCDGRLWLSQDNTLYRIDTSANPFTYTSVSSAAFGFNAGDVNPTDGSIYAIRVQQPPGPNSNNLVRIDSAGAITDIGNITGLPTTQTYISGAFTTSGNILYVMGNTLPSNTLYAVNVTTFTATAITLSRAITIADLAFTNGALYAIEQSGQMIRIALTSATTATVSNVGSLNGVTNGVFVGGMVGAPNGLFGAANNGGFYQFDVLTGAATLLSGAPPSNANEAFHCPTVSVAFGADLRVTKTNTPASGPNDLSDDTYAPGQTRTYDVVVSNPGPFGAQNQNARDTLPAGIAAAIWTCAVTTGSPTGTSCSSASGSTSNGVINWTGIDLPVGGSVTFRVTLTVPASYTGSLVNTAQVLPTDTVIDSNAGNNSATDTDPSVPRLTIVKTSQRGVGSFSFSGSNGVQAQTLTTTVAGTPVSGATLPLTAPGVVTAVTEAVPSNYLLTGIACTGLGAGGTATPDLSTGTVTLDAAATPVNASITCSFTNTLKQTDVQVVKSASPNPVLSGDTVTYTIVVSNNGPLAADGAALSDSPGPGQACTTAACSATSGATCPAGGTSNEAVSVAALTGGGITLPALPVGGTVTVTMTCTVTASGSP